jgi:2-dehydropantoate 2-reductase
MGPLKNYTLDQIQHRFVVKSITDYFLKCIIRNYLVDTIEETMWEKFIFISALASATSYLNQNIGK